MLKTLAALFRRWTWEMAWRDSRNGRARLILFSLSISFGVAALVAIGSLGRSMRRTVDAHSRALLGADLVFSSRQPFSSEAEAVFQNLGLESAREVGFSSMIVFEKDGSTRLVQARALDGPFPWYGKIETEPDSAASLFRSGGGVLIEESLAIQFGAAVGDTVRIGDWRTSIVGVLKKVPGDAIAFSTIAPRVYLAGTRLAETGLLKSGSLARYRAMFRTPASVDVDKLVKARDAEFTRLRLSTDTVGKRKADLGKSIDEMERFLNLSALIALLLGAVGIASAIHVHLIQKIPNVGVLRCLGASQATAFGIYLAQAIGLGATGTGIGVIAGLALERWLPSMVQSFVPFEIVRAPSILAAGGAAATGVMICVVFALLPLIPVRSVSPLMAIRSAFDGQAVQRRRTMRRSLWTIYGLIGMVVAGFSVLQTGRWGEGLAFAGGLAVTFGILAAAARGLVSLTRQVRWEGMPFVWHQGLANLHRPNNRTGLVVVALGLGTFLILTQQLVRDTVLRQMFPPGGSSQPNAILFDIQPDQREAVGAALGEEGFRVLDEAPIVTMRLASVKGQTTESILADKADRGGAWALRREYRSTWRTNLAGGEELAGGTFTGFVPEGTIPVPISVEDGIARELGVTIGDELVFDVQGVLLTNRITSLRKVDWRQVRPNFFVVFPAGALEAAPVMHVMATRVENAGDSARMQRRIVRQFPNVSVIDLTLVLKTLDDLLSRLGLVVRLMTLFTLATGVVVLAGTILTGRWQRVREGILLRTLGANRRQLRWILVAEYLFLGVLAATAGSLLAVGSSWGLARFAFKIEFAMSPLPVVAAIGGATLLTVVVGLLSSRGVCDQPPLEILRRES